MSKRRNAVFDVTFGFRTVRVIAKTVGAAVHQACKGYNFQRRSDGRGGWSNVIVQIIGRYGKPVESRTWQQALADGIEARKLRKQMAIT